MRRIDEPHLKPRFSGNRMLCDMLKRKSARTVASMWQATSPLKDHGTAIALAKLLSFQQKCSICANRFDEMCLVLPHIASANTSAQLFICAVELNKSSYFSVAYERFAGANPSWHAACYIPVEPN